MTHVRTSVGYPQSNGKLERWHRSVKSEALRPANPNPPSRRRSEFWRPTCITTLRATAQRLDHIAPPGLHERTVGANLGRAGSASGRSSCPASPAPRPAARTGLAPLRQPPGGGLCMNEPLCFADCPVRFHWASTNGLSAQSGPSRIGGLEELVPGRPSAPSCTHWPRFSSAP